MKKIVILIMLMFASGCAFKGYNNTYDNTLRDSAIEQYHAYLKDRYKDEPCWYTAMTNLEKKNLKEIRKIKPEIKITESVKMYGTGDKSIKFTNGAEASNDAGINLSMPENIGTSLT